MTDIKSNNELSKSTNTSEVIDNNIEKVLETLDKLDNFVLKATNFANVIVTIKQLDIEIQNMDYKFNLILKKTDDDLEKFKRNASIIEGQLNAISNRFDKMLDKALSIDTKTNDTQEIELRTTFLSQINKWSDQISTLIMELIKY